MSIELNELFKTIKEEYEKGNLGKEKAYSHALKMIGSTARDAEEQDKIEVISRLKKVYKQFGDAILQHLPENARELLKNENIIN